MSSPRILAAAAAGLIAFGGAAFSAHDAEAQSISRHRSASINGPHHNASRGADIYRSPGSASVSRYGSVDGRGWSSSRSRSTVETADGRATSMIRVGPSGRSQTRESQTHVGDDYYSRSSGVQTSTGRGYERDVDATRTEDGLVIDRSLTTNSGASRDSTVVRPW